MTDEPNIAVTGAHIVPSSKVPAISNTFNLNQDGSGTNIGVAQNVEHNTYHIPCFYIRIFRRKLTNHMLRGK